MNQSWYHVQSWYAPLVSNEAEADLTLANIEELPDKGGIKRRKRHSGGLTPGRIVGLVLILIVVIVGSSLAFRQIDGSGEDQFSFFADSSDEDTEMPDTPADFFEQQMKTRKCRILRQTSSSSFMKTWKAARWK